MKHLANAGREKTRGNERHAGHRKDKHDPEFEDAGTHKVYMDMHGRNIKEDIAEYLNDEPSYRYRSVSR